MQIRKPSFFERILFAEESLKVVDRINKQSNGKLQICDFHIGNFGFSTDIKVKLVDFDLLVIKKFVKKYLSNIKSCSKDSDCVYGYFEDDCASQCNTINSTCIYSDRIRYTNLQNFCQNVLLLVLDDTACSKQIEKNVRRKCEMIHQTCEQFIARSSMSLEVEFKRASEVTSLL